MSLLTQQSQVNAETAFFALASGGGPTGPTGPTGPSGGGGGGSGVTCAKLPRSSFFASATGLMPSNDTVALSQLVPLTAGHSYLVSYGPLKLQSPAPLNALVYFDGASANLNQVSVGFAVDSDFTRGQCVFGPIAQTGFGQLMITNNNTSPTTVLAQDAASFQMVIQDLGVL